MSVYWKIKKQELELSSPGEFLIRETIPLCNQKQYAVIYHKLKMSKKVSVISVPSDHSCYKLVVIIVICTRSGYQEGYML